MEGSGFQPEQQGRLFEPGEAVQRGSDIVATEIHLLTDPCVTGFVGSKEGQGAQLEKVCEEENEETEEQSATVREQ